MNRSNNDMERKIHLEKLKKSDNLLVSRTANILSTDISDKIVNDMKSEWDFCRVDVIYQETEWKNIK